MSAVLPTAVRPPNLHVMRAGREFGAEGAINIKKPVINTTQGIA